MRESTKTIGTPSRRDPVQGLGDALPDEMAPLPLGPWPETGYRVWSHAKSGAWIGAIAGCTSLLTNIIGGVLWPAISGTEQHPLRFIQVFLTFPLGESALQLNSGFILAFGCLLYLATGVFYGILFEISISSLLPHANLSVRLMACTILSLCVWAVNFYAILFWLQPLLFNGRWIIDLIPWWVAAVTHLVFGWTIALVQPITNSSPIEGAVDTTRPT